MLGVCRGLVFAEGWVLVMGADGEGFDRAGVRSD